MSFAASPESVTVAQNAANLRTVRARVAARLGIDPANIASYEQRTQYNKALAAEIVAFPQSFNSGTLDTARRVLGTNYQPLADTSFDFGAYVDEFSNEVSETLPSVGNKLLVGLVIVAAVYVAVRAWRTAPAS